jgi:histidinol-phosphate aminotransferase
MSLFRPVIDAMQGYIPGEQPTEAGWVKLNTNENPYSPSPEVKKAIVAASDGRLNIYPDPLVKAFRESAAELFGVDADWVLPANGSDENLTILMRSFVDAGEQIAYPYPSYVLYETLAEIQGAKVARLPLTPDWHFDWKTTDPRVAASKLAFVPNPNSPSGNRWGDEELQWLTPEKGLLVLDEAYGDFADKPHKAELLQSEIGKRMVITRTLSKSYSLAGIRFGFAIAHPDIIAGMRKVKDSYNCDSIAIAAATAAIQDQTWMLTNREKIVTTRTCLTEALSEMGFVVTPTQANFVWCTHPDHAEGKIYEELKSRKILVRYMKFPYCGPEENEHREGLRISIGTEGEIDMLLKSLKELVE